METTEKQAVPSFTMEQIATAIESMAKQQAGASRSIAKVIVMAAWSANSAADAGVANALMANLRKGVKKDAIVAILVEHCNLAYVSGTFAMFPSANKVWDDESVKTIKIAAIGWESYKKAAPAVTRVDLIDELASLVDRLVSKHAKLQLDHADQLDSIKALLGSMQAVNLFDGE